MTPEERPQNRYAGRRAAARRDATARRSAEPRLTRAPAAMDGRNAQRALAVLGAATAG